MYLCVINRRRLGESRVIWRTYIVRSISSQGAVRAAAGTCSAHYLNHLVVAVAVVDVVADLTVCVPVVTTTGVWVGVSGLGSAGVHT